ncbi:gluconokinase [Haloechinothrix halophila]|uniref:Gluconokinase n=1 Tax=Haloechinothrix halophila YIM 93223 TaxID=592678 RepID=W9DN35_9PSEU|nr:gluconokinase [Haloechinothrix halophila]ETA66250.1 carbohydrate kinase, thermoresistant glucokinase family [Haloechinothrix halophila YIM 93223]
MSDRSQATCVVVMGVSGVGKSTTAQLIADTLGWPLAEADDFHPRANIDKMSAGLPLTDADRRPWLGAIRDWISERSAAGVSVVVTCSALKRSYRDVLRKADARVRFVFLHTAEDVVRDRLSRRSGHFMPTALLGSQFADLQPLAPDEDGVSIDPAGAPRAVAATALARLGLPSPPSDPRQSTSNGAS